MPRLQVRVEQNKEVTWGNRAGVNMEYLDVGVEYILGRCYQLTLVFCVSRVMGKRTFLYYAGNEFISDSDVSAAVCIVWCTSYLYTVHWS